MLIQKGPSTTGKERCKWLGELKATLSLCSITRRSIKRHDVVELQLEVGHQLQDTASYP
jgi:hypothetical protein